MKIIKLDAIDSTNSFLKDLQVQTPMDDFTVVVAKHQTKGRGQMNSNWQVEVGKNLTYSVFCLFSGLKITHHKYLNFCVALSVFDALNEVNIPDLAIKWPNDIMSANKKIAGILIENSLKGSNIGSSIIGVGINANQITFSEDLPNASSMKLILDKHFDLDVLLQSVLLKLQNRVRELNDKKYAALEKAYLNVLYKKNVPTMFKNSQNILFMGKIIGVSKNGNLLIELADETIQEFGLKEVSFANL